MNETLNIQELDYVFANLKNINSDKLVIVLPEIFGLTKQIQDVVNKFTQDAGVLAFAIDHFYPINSKPILLD